MDENNNLQPDKPPSESESAPEEILSTTAESTNEITPESTQPSGWQEATASEIETAAETQEETQPEEEKSASMDMDQGNIRPEITSTPEIPPTEEIAVKEESRTKRFLRKLFRWILGILIVFGLGFLTAVVVYYRPAHRQLEATLLEKQTAMETVSSQKAKIADLESKIRKQQDELDYLKNTNLKLKVENSQKSLQVALTKANVSTSKALVFLLEKKTTESRKALTETSELIKEIKTLLPDSQSKNIDSIEKRLNLVISEIRTNPSTAHDDLNIMLKELAKIEHTLFPAP